MSIGPVQMLILGFEDPKFKGEALAELQKLRDADIIRVIDALVVWKDAEGNVTELKPAPAEVGINTAVVTSDPVSGGILVLHKDDKFYALDPIQSFLLKVNVCP